MGLVVGYQAVLSIGFIMCVRVCASVCECVIVCEIDKNILNYLYQTFIFFQIEMYA